MSYSPPPFSLFRFLATRMEHKLTIRQLQKQFSKYRPPALPYAQSNTGGTGTGYSYGQGNNPYSSNPPPPQNSSFNGGNPYGFNPPPPPATYQPSMAGQYTGASKTGTAAGSDNAHEHGYEWEQAREAERLEREQQAGGHAPPGYDVSNTQSESKSPIEASPSDADENSTYGNWIVRTSPRCPTYQASVDKLKKARKTTTRMIQLRDE